MYRRRRLVLLLALLAIGAAVVWLLVAQPWAGAASENPSPQVSQTPDASPTPAATPTATPTAEAVATPAPTPSGTGQPAIDPCDDGDVAVEAVTDRSSYAADQQPALTIKLTNTSPADCTLNVGTSGQVFTVTSGSDVWWRSTDCQTESSDMVVTLKAGQSVASASPLVWDRTRSSVDTCDDDTRQRAPGGGASYHLSVQIAGIEAESTAQFLLY